ncbi:MAG: hypothetical protein KDC38_17265, partial [Planctomycetes bacterium]|nr:hypothetical protein [Planctomycetota bacterium]
EAASRIVEATAVYDARRSSVALYEEEILPARHRRLDLARGAFAVGTTTSRAVIEAQRDLLAASSAAIDARLSLRQSLRTAARWAGVPLSSLGATEAPREPDHPQPATEVQP